MRMDEYLRTVTEQVRCSKIHDSIAEELKDHILDQAEAFEEEGTDHEQALELAVREMGDPVETGVALDRIHRPHMSVEMLVLVSLISVLSLVFYGAMLFLAGDNSINGMEYWFHQQVKYTVTGFLLMLLVCRIDYSILGKWSRQIAGGILLFILLSLVTGVQVYGRIYGLRVGPVMIPTFGMIWLYVPAYAAVLYTYRGRSYKGLTGLLIWTLLPVFLVLRLPGLNQAVMLLFICLLLFSIAVGKGWYQVSPRKMLAAVWGMMILAPAMMLGTGMLAEYQVKRLQAWLGYGEPSYAAQTAYECLRTSRLLGASGNHVWQKLPGWNSEYILVSLTSAYGLLAAVTAVALLLLLWVKMFHISSHQKNQLGMMVGYGCSMVLLAQSGLVLAMNLGLLPSAAITIPFFSAGGSNMVSSYILTGMVLSIYRYKDILPGNPVKRMHPASAE